MGEFSKIYACLHRTAARTQGNLDERLRGTRRRVTARDILGWFQKAGLCGTHE